MLQALTVCVLSKFYIASQLQSINQRFWFFFSLICLLIYFEPHIKGMRLTGRYIRSITCSRICLLVCQQFSCKPAMTRGRCLPWWMHTAHGWAQGFWLIKVTFCFSGEVVGQGLLLQRSFATAAVHHLQWWDSNSWLPGRSYPFIKATNGSKDGVGVSASGVVPPVG